MHDLDLLNGSRSNVKNVNVVSVPIQSQCRTFYFTAIVTFSIFVTICEIFAVEICMSLTFRMIQGQTQIYQSKANKRLPVFAIVIFALSPFVR